MPLDSETLESTKTEARRLVSLLHTQTGISLERVRSTVDRLVELTSLLGIHGKSHGKPSKASPSEDRADPQMQEPGGRASGREPRSEEAPEEDPQRQDDSSEGDEQWLNNEQWSG